MIKPTIVLILIIMEDTLRDKLLLRFKLKVKRLNPYYNGRYSPSLRITKIRLLLKSLNPYYNGRYSPSSKVFGGQALAAGLNPYYNGRYSPRLQ